MRNLGRCKQVVVIGDTHCGCSLGLCPPFKRYLGDEGGYMLGPTQKALWAYWRDFTENWIPEVTKGEPWDLVHGGDIIDGRHHHATSQFTQNLSVQRQVAEDALGPLVKACWESGGRFFVIRGTPAHGGESGEDDNTVAKALNAVADKAGHYARNDLWLRVGSGLVHFAHHIGTTGTSHYETSAVHREMVEAFNESGRWHNEPPDVVVRFHRHRFVKTEMTGSRDGKHRLFISCVAPGWQGKGPYAYRIAGGRLAPPQFGGLIVRAGNEELYVREMVYTIQRSRTE